MKIIYVIKSEKNNSNITVENKNKNQWNNYDSVFGGPEIEGVWNNIQAKGI